MRPQHSVFQVETLITFATCYLNVQSLNVQSLDSRLNIQSQYLAQYSAQYASQCVTQFGAFNCGEPSVPQSFQYERHTLALTDKRFLLRF